MILLVLGVLVLAEVLALLWLASTVGSYKTFWENKAQQPGELTYLALGDSAAQAIGATSPSKGYVGIIAARLEQETGKTVRTVNVSKTGARMTDYLEEQAPRIKDFKADVVTIEIGANDIVGFKPDTYRSDFRRVLQTLPPGTHVSNMPLFNTRPGSTNNAKLASKIIEEELQDFPKLHFVDLQKQTTEHQSIFGLAPDLFHPSNSGYRNWADAFWKSIQDSDSL